MIKAKVKGMGVAAVLMLVVTVVFAHSNTTQGEERVITPVTELNLSYDFPTANNLQQMTMEADLIVVGEYTGYESSWNMARNPGDVQSEDTENYVEGHLYSFTIHETLKGIAENSKILVNHRFSESIDVVESNAVIQNGLIQEPATQSRSFKISIHGPRFIEPTLGTSYILFLNYDANFSNYYGAIEPFSIKISAEGKAILQSNLINRTESFHESIKLNSKRIITTTILVSAALPDTVSGMSIDTLKARIISY